MSFTIHTTDKQFESLHVSTDKCRKNAKNVTVDRQALVNLLMDHSNMVAKLQEM